MATRDPNKNYFGGTPYREYDERTGTGFGGGALKDGPFGQPDVTINRDVPPTVSPRPPAYTPSGGRVTDVSGQIGRLGEKTYHITPGEAEAATRAVEEEELSRKQLALMLDPNSELMRRASATGQAIAGQRGLMNSNLAAGAAHGVMIDRAQPFALSDADAYRRAASENLQARNAARLQNAQARTQANIAAANLTGALDQTTLQAQAQALMQSTDLRWRTGERQDTQAWQTSERLGAQDFTAGENALNREWQTGERVGQQGWQSGENRLNREWTTAENIRQNALQWAQTQLQVYASWGMTREQARSQVLADIYGNPNLTASEQNAAAANAMRVLDGMAYDQPFEPPPGMPTYYPWGSTPPAAMTPEQTAAANEAVGQTWTSYMNPGVGRTIRNLPPVT